MSVAILSVGHDCPGQMARLSEGEVTYARPIDKPLRIARDIGLSVVPAVNGSAPVQVLRATFPKDTIVQLEYNNDLQGQWKPIGAPVLILDGKAEITAPFIGDNGFFRLSGKPFPGKVEIQNGAPKLTLTEPVSSDHLDLFLRGSLSVDTVFEAAPGAVVSPGSLGLTRDGSLGGITVTNASRFTQTYTGFSSVRPLSSRMPKLSAVENGDEVSEVGRMMHESFLVPMTWTVSSPEATKATWMIQRTAFPASSNYSSPAYQSIIGEVAIPVQGQSGDGRAVAFPLDFGKQNIYGLDTGMELYARIFERDKDGNVLGGGSNVFTFTISERPTESERLSSRNLEFSNTLLECIETTSGAGADEIVLMAYTVEFQEDGIEVAQVSSIPQNGYMHKSFDSDFPQWSSPIKKIWRDSTPSSPPENVWVIYALQEVDDHLDPFFGSGSHTGVTDSSIRAKGSVFWNSIKDSAVNFPWSTLDTPYDKQALVCSYLYNFIQDTVADRGIDDVFAGAWFRIEPAEFLEAMNSFPDSPRKTISLKGDGAEYFADFRYRWN